MNPKIKKAGWTAYGVLVIYLLFDDWRLFLRLNWDALLLGLIAFVLIIGKIVQRLFSRE